MDTLRARKRARTRADLSRAALALFAERGFAATTVDDIAAAADVSRRTFFRHYGTKEAAAFPDREDRLARLRAALGPRGAPELDRVREGLGALARDYEGRRDDVRAHQQVIRSEPALLAHQRELDAEWVEALAEALCDPQRPYRTRVLAHAVVGVLRASFDAWLADDAPDDLAAPVLEGLELLAHGFQE